MISKVDPNVRRVGITGLGVYVPDRVLTNADLEKMVDTNDEWITTRTGIKERRIARDDQAASDLAIPAARQALERAGSTRPTSTSSSSRPRRRTCSSRRPR